MANINIINNYGIINFKTRKNKKKVYRRSNCTDKEVEPNIINFRVCGDGLSDINKRERDLHHSQPVVINGGVSSAAMDLNENSTEQNSSNGHTPPEMTHLHTKSKSQQRELSPSCSKIGKHTSLSFKKKKEHSTDTDIHSPLKTTPQSDLVSSKLSRVNSFGDVFDCFFEGEGLKESSDLLKSWVGGNEMKLVYDSSQQFFDSKGFNEKVCGRKNLLIVVVSGKSIFGSWHSKQIPKEKKDGFVYVKNDENHFVFTLRNIYNLPPAKFCPRRVNKHCKSLCLSGSKNETCIVGCYSCYFVETRADESTVDWSFSSLYIDTTGKGHLIFTGKQAFTTDRLLAFSTQ